MGKSARLPMNSAPDSAHTSRGKVVHAAAGRQSGTGFHASLTLFLVVNSMKKDISVINGFSCGSLLTFSIWLVTSSSFPRLSIMLDISLRGE
jgi:hypothetical protein